MWVEAIIILIALHELLVHVFDHTACGFFEKTRYDRMYKGCAPRYQKTRGKPPRKSQMFKISFINGLRVMNEDAFPKLYHEYTCIRKFFIIYPNYAVILSQIIYLLELFLGYYPIYVTDYR